MLTAGAPGSVYDGLVVAHVISALVGFGSVALSGVYGYMSRRPVGPQSLDEARRYFRSPGRLELLVLAVPLFGIAALIVEPGGRGAGQLWAILAVGVWLVAATVLLGVVRPAEGRLRAELSGPAPDGAMLDDAGRRLGWGGVVADLAFLVAIGLMVFQPR